MFCIFVATKMPTYLIILLTFIISYLLFITSFLLIYVIITGKRQNLVNTSLSNLLTIHNEQITSIEQRLPITINNQGILE